MTEQSSDNVLDEVVVGVTEELDNSIAQHSGNTVTEKPGENLTELESENTTQQKDDKITQQSEDSVEGQLVHIRRCSKKIIFIDLEEKCGDKQELRRVTVALKSWEISPETMVSATKGPGKLHVGDTAVFAGVWEKDTGVFTVRSFVITQYWSQANPDKVFVPKPACDNVRNVMKNVKEGEIISKEGKNSFGECKFHLNTGHCPKISCKYKHSGNVSERIKYVKEKKERRVLVHEAELDGTEKVSGASQRAAVFAEWIVNTYGKENLSQGIILDIGGGRGDLAFELASKRGLQCVVVDPRPPKLKRWQVKHRRKHPEAGVAKHYQTYFNKEFLSSHSICPSSVRLVVGLHPDEATEPLVVTALSLSLDFAVIPCCVFAASFPERRLRDGRSPASYEQFCMYLEEMDARLKHGRLPFLGKNKVIFLKQEECGA